MELWIASDMDPKLIKMLMIAGVGGLIGSLLGFLVAVFGTKDERIRVENATGIGFLVGASIGALIGVFATMLDRV